MIDSKVKIEDKLVLILERSNKNLELRKEGEEYILEGVAAIFGEENNNQRIYEEKEYLPHLEYLNKKISENRLLGELDHPEKFDVSLQNASHMVEELKYDPDKRNIKIKVRLLDTPNGKIAKNLVDSGVPISISSRAAGIVESDKKVRIKRIFTYDLVADPGFESAQLNRVNESLGYGNLEFVDIYDMGNDLKENYDRLVEIEIPEKNKDSEMEGKNYVTVEELNQWSLLVKKEISALKEKAESKDISESDENNLTERLGKIEKYVNYLAESLDKNIQYSEYLAENVDNSIEYNKYLAENLDKNISYSEYLAENLDKNISYSNYLAENVDKNIGYGEYIAEKLDKSIGYGEYLAQHVDKNIGYSNYIAENVDRGISYSEYLAEKLDKNISYSEYIAESVNKKGSGKEEGINEEEIKEEKTKPIRESIGERYEKLSSSVDSLLESVKKQKTEEIINESQYHFFRFLSDEKRREFIQLEETKKTRVINALSNATYTSEYDITSIWEDALLEKKETEPIFIKDMPEDVKPIWENLESNVKNAIIAQSASYNLETPYQIKHFWSTRRLSKDTPVLEKLNENEVADTSIIKPNLRGYGNDYMKSVMEGLDKYSPKNKKV